MKQKNEQTAILIAIIALVVSIFSFIIISKQQTELRSVVSSDLKNLKTRIDVSNPQVVKGPINETVPKNGKLIKVIRVIDGDTIELEGGEKLRYIGIDTPELHDPRKPVQCFAQKASDKNKELVEGKFIKFYKDINERDKYQRLLGYVYTEDGLFINLELVKTGYAFSYTYPPDISKQTEFQKAEQVAKEKKLGLWANCAISKNSTGRSETNSIITTTDINKS